MNIEAFSYSKETGQFVSKITCDIDQLNDDRVLVPAYATQKVMPDTGENEVAVFRSIDGGIPRNERDGKWQVVVDQRGKEYWDVDGTKHTIAALGVEVPEGALLEAPVIPPTEAELAATARATRDTLVSRVSREIERRVDVGEDVTAWRTYRQFLRDIPTQDGFPNTVDWGTQPADFTGK